MTTPARRSTAATSAPQLTPQLAFPLDLPLDLPLAPPSATLARWDPEQWPVSPDWQPVVSRFLHSESALHLGRFIQNRLAQGATIYPPLPFAALAMTPLDCVKVVILGQDPYHGPGQAQGLAFSVAPGVAVPPSLRNIFKEITRDSVAGTGVGRVAGAGAGADAEEDLARLPSRPQRHTNANGSLASWAQQGVLLLNTCLTVEQGQPACHAKQGWEVLTDAIIQAVGASQHPVVFMLWGAHAQAKQGLLGNTTVPTAGVAPSARGTAPRLVLAANHPSPLSALRPPRPFIGCGHFGVANAFLRANGQEPVTWL